MNLMEKRFSVIRGALKKQLPINWNLRGSFGILGSGREDNDCEDWHGHKLDRKPPALKLAH